MSLLPKTHQEFSKPQYWDTFFKRRGQKAFEWYGEFAELSGYLLKYVKQKDKILIIGCGNSTLGMDLYDCGHKNLTSIDISQIVIKQMLEKNKTSRPDLVFEVKDATNMDYKTDQFTAIIDKGTLDALMPDTNQDTLLRIEKYFKEIQRVLSNCGRYICISLLQEHILRKLLDSFPKTEFAIRVVRCHDVEIKAKEEDENCMPVFMVIATKFPKLVNPILELSFTEDSTTRLSSVEDVINSVISVQESALLCYNLNKGSVANDGEVSLDLYRPGDVEPRYTIYVVDQATAKKKKTYAAFIVPQGREVDWLFSTKEGRKQLLESAQFNRLAIVVLNRKQHFENLDFIKNELADSVKNLAPSGLNKTQIPFLSLGSDVGQRNVCFEGESKMSGKFVVEEVQNDDGLFRRLIFLNNQFVVQSEAKLKKEKGKYVVDPWYLAHDHHIFMSLGVNNALKNKSNGRVVVVGLGGGGLCMFLRQISPKVHITAVEIDEEIFNVAKQHFDLREDDMLNVKIADGLEFLRNSTDQPDKFDAILFDVDSKDASVGMSCPPQEFVDYSFLETVHKNLTKDGIFILNLVARNSCLRDEVVKNLKNIFNFVATYKILEAVNEIIYCLKSKTPFDEWKNLMKKSANYFNRQSKSKSSSSKEVLEISSLLSNFKLEN